MTAERWSDDLAERRRRQRVAFRIILRNLMTNAVGLGFLTFYEAISAEKSLREAWDAVIHNMVGNGLTLFLILLAMALIWLLTRSLRRWYLPPSGEPLPRQATRSVRKLAHLPPFLTSAVVLIAWGTRGLIVAWQAGDEHIALFLFLSNGMAGLIAATLAYFATESLWQRELPLFFPEGEGLEQRKWRLTVRLRLLLIFAMGLASLLYLAVIAYGWAYRIPEAEDPETLLTRLLYIEMLIVGASSATALFLAATLGTSLVHGLERIRDGMQRVQEGDLETQVKVWSDDELGELAAGFNHMVRSLRQESVLQQLFARYVSPEVANYALQHGAQRGGVLTEATILFSDIRSFTALAESLPPTTVMAMLNRYFQAMEETIRAYGGIINKFVGDSLMAIFGTPLNPLADHAEAAIWAATEMMRTLRLFNEAQQVRGEPTLRIGIGIATGAVVAGNVGGTERIEYTLIGNTVNVASRLESMTKELDVPILLAGETAQAAGGMVPLRLLGQVEIRGKREKVTVYTIDANL